MAGNPLTDLYGSEGKPPRLYFCPSGAGTLGAGRTVCGDIREWIHGEFPMGNADRLMHSLNAWLKAHPGGRGLSDDEIEYLALNDIADNVAICIEAFGLTIWERIAPEGIYVEHAPTWSEMALEQDWIAFSVRHRALLELAHGLGSFVGFPSFVRSIREGRYDMAALHLEWKDPLYRDRGRTAIWTQWLSGLPGEQRLERIQRWLTSNKEEA